MATGLPLADKILEKRPTDVVGVIEDARNAESHARVLMTMKAYIEAHRSDIEQDINDFGDLRPLLAILD